MYTEPKQVTFTNGLLQTLCSYGSIEGVVSSGPNGRSGINRWRMSEVYSGKRGQSVGVEKQGFGGPNG